jgi:hypothetical protein
MTTLQGILCRKPILIEAISAPQELSGGVLNFQQLKNHYRGRARSVIGECERSRFKHRISLTVWKNAKSLASVTGRHFQNGQGKNKQKKQGCCHIIMQRLFRHRGKNSVGGRKNVPVSTAGFSILVPIFVTVYIKGCVELQCMNYAA